MKIDIFRNLVLRDDFCSQSCLHAYTQRQSRQRAWEKQRGADDQANTLTANNTSELTGKLRPCVVPLQEGNGGPRLYFISADVSAFRLAQFMGQRRAIFGVQIPWASTWRKAAIDNDIASLPTMEEIAARYAEALGAHARDLPCVVAGYSFFGLIAFETARQLRAQGINVTSVILIDSRTKYPLQARQFGWRKLRDIWNQPLEGGLPKRFLSIFSAAMGSWLPIQFITVSVVKSLAVKSVQTIIRDPGHLSEIVDEDGIRLHWSLLQRMIRNIGERYLPNAIDCRGILFRVDQSHDRLAREFDHDMGWRDLFSGGLQIIEMPGDHFTLMRQESYNLTLAQKLNELLS